MKESKLIREMNSTSRKLEESKIVDDCYELARTKGEIIGGHCGSGKWKRGGSLQYLFSKDDLKIELMDANDSSTIGKIGINVYFDNNIVMEGIVLRSCKAEDEKEYKFNPKINGLCILTYKPGEWEKHVKEYLNY